MGAVGRPPVRGCDGSHLDACRARPGGPLARCDLAQRLHQAGAPRCRRVHQQPAAPARSAALHRVGAVAGDHRAAARAPTGGARDSGRAARGAGHRRAAQAAARPPPRQRRLAVGGSRLVAQRPCDRGDDAGAVRAARHPPPSAPPGCRAWLRICRGGRLLAADPGLAHAQRRARRLPARGAVCVAHDRRDGPGVGSAGPLLRRRRSV